MNAEEQDQNPPILPAGVKLPTDHQAAREAIAVALEQEMEHARSNAFLSEFFTRQRVTSEA